MRGKVNIKDNKTRDDRITPAYAGKSGIGVIQGRKPMGSPPRMRGKVFQLLCMGYAVGITPAYAGKSIGHDCQRRPNRDHPRVCGEKRQIAVKLHDRQGSPPRMRGKD